MKIWIANKKERKTKRINLKEWLEQFYNQPIEVILSTKREPSEEVDWGKTVGNEVW